MQKTIWPHLAVEKKILPPWSKNPKFINIPPPPPLCTLAYEKCPPQKNLAPLWPLEKNLPPLTPPPKKLTPSKKADAPLLVKNDSSLR